MTDIDGLTRRELLALNHRIVERLKHLDQVEAHEAMMKYRPGDRVSFTSNDGREVSGVLMKYNQKTVTVIADSGERWNVSPGFLRKEAIEGEKVGTDVVVPIKKG